MADGSKPMTKTQIVAYFSEKNGMPKKDVAQFFDDITELAAKEANSAGAFTIPGIGKITKVHRKARPGRNPRTGEPIHIPAKTALKMRLSKAFSQLIF